MYLLAALETSDTGGVRLLYLFMLLLAIILILTGCIIALLTLRNQRKNGQLALMFQEQSDQEIL
jgi:cytochrome b subunit of formate dehydrogenase